MCIDLIMDSELVEMGRVPVENVDNDPTELFERIFSRNRKLPGPVRPEVGILNREVSGTTRGVFNAQGVDVAWGRSSLS